MARGTPARHVDPTKDTPMHAIRRHASSLAVAAVLPLALVACGNDDPADTTDTTTEDMTDEDMTDEDMTDEDMTDDMTDEMTDEEMTEEEMTDDMTDEEMTEEG